MDRGGGGGRDRQYQHGGPIPTHTDSSSSFRILGQNKKQMEVEEEHKGYERKNLDGAENIIGEYLHNALNTDSSS